MSESDWEDGKENRRGGRRVLSMLNAKPKIDHRNLMTLSTIESMVEKKDRVTTRLTAADSTMLHNGTTGKGLTTSQNATRTPPGRPLVLGKRGFSQRHHFNQAATLLDEKDHTNRQTFILQGQY